MTIKRARSAYIPGQVIAHFWVQFFAHLDSFIAKFQ